MDDEEESYLMAKNLKKGTIRSTYKPITCLPTMWKIPITQVREEIYMPQNPSW